LLVKVQGESPVAGRRKKADTELVLALAFGATPESAAQRAGVSLRTVYRRLAEPVFRGRVHDVRAEMVQRMAGTLTAAGVGALRTLIALQESAASESVRLGAARTVIEQGCKVRESVEHTERLKALEARVEQLLEDTQNGAGDGAS
jgi:type II secretory pathway component PulF